jgi:hypothetical protein
MKLWMMEHGAKYDVPAIIEELVLQGRLFDWSYHNDVCPRFATSDVIPVENPQNWFDLWVENPEKNSREYEWAGRYTVFQLDEDGQSMTQMYTGDDLEAALKAMGVISN